MASELTLRARGTPPTRRDSAVMSAAASLMFSAGGWNGVCVLGALTALVGLAIWPRTRRQNAC